MNKIFQSFIIILSLVLVSCKGEEETAPLTAVASIVTYESTENGVSTFTYTDSQESLITLSATWNGNDELQPGARVLIYYTADEYGVSGAISLLSVTRLPGGVPVVAPAADIPRSESLQQCSLWRSGEYLNISATINFAGNASQVALYVDEATAELQVPTAYVVVVPEDYSSPGVERSLYASWNISDILSAPNFEALKVVYTNSANNPSELTITL